MATQEQVAAAKAEIDAKRGQAAGNKERPSQAAWIAGEGAAKGPNVGGTVTFYDADEGSGILAVMGAAGPHYRFTKGKLSISLDMTMRQVRDLLRERCSA